MCRAGWLPGHRGLFSKGFSADYHFIALLGDFFGKSQGTFLALVGTQLQAARGVFNITEFRNIIEAKDCTLAYFNVAGFGLYLESIQYPEGKLTELTDIR